MSDWDDWLVEFAARHDLDEVGRAELAAALTHGPSTSPPSAMSGETWIPGDGPAHLSDPTDSAQLVASSLGRYAVVSLLGVGGSGIVYRGWDPKLRRSVALKVLHDNAHRASTQQRFVEEAQLTARLEHPGVVPVHTLERLPDGRLLFTMKEVQGETLEAVIRRLHSLAAETECGRRALRRLISSFQRACEAVAYAHSLGVVHRDLKPANIMLGDFGQALVLDWGLSRRVGTDNPGGGTAHFMSPEQARPSERTVQRTTDVYALGAILYTILNGASPFAGLASEDVLAHLRRGEVARPVQAPPGTEALAALCSRAMAPEPADRYPDAGAFSVALIAWLDGAAAAERADRLVEEADASGVEGAGHARAAEALRAQAEAAMTAVPPHAPIADKRAGWELEDAAEREAQQARGRSAHRLQLLQAALRHAPHHARAHALLAEHYHGRHRDAEAAGDAAEAASTASLLALHDRAGRFAGYLSGDGALTLHTEPSGASVTLLEYVREDRRLVPRPVRDLGPTPIDGVPLPPGSYLLHIRHPERLSVRYPVHIQRGTHHLLRGPVRLPPDDALDPGVEAYVPAGWFVSGGRAAGSLALPQRRLWCHSFILRRFPVTNAEYLEFVNDLLVTQGEAEALRWAPQERPGPRGVPGAQLCGRDREGRFVLVPDPDGDVWMPDWPVTYVDWEAAVQYGRWLSARDGLPWRLPGELEWERAARGADGRRYPWGDFIDPTWCNNRLSSAAREVSVPVTAYPADESPFGVRGMAGNVMDWCLDAGYPEGPAARDGEDVPPVEPSPESERRRVLRGGSWWTPPHGCSAVDRNIQPGTARDGARGFRLLRPWPG